MMDEKTIYTLARQFLSNKKQWGEFDRLLIVREGPWSIFTDKQTPDCYELWDTEKNFCYCVFDSLKLAVHSIIIFRDLYSQDRERLLATPDALASLRLEVEKLLTCSYLDYAVWFAGIENLAPAIQEFVLLRVWNRLKFERELQNSQSVTPREANRT